MAVPPGFASGFYAVEMAVHRGFLDAVGPADQGWCAAPWSALCEVEAGVAADAILYASDSGYRTRSTDPLGVVAYPPTVIDAIQIDVAVNLDPTASSVAAAWGTLKLANFDGRYDAYIAGWQSDGQAITIYRGDRIADNTRGLSLDPPRVSLVPIFAGVMGPWQPQNNTVSLELRDASYFLEKPIARTFYAGTGGAEGTASLAGVAKPIVFGGGSLVTVNVANITPLLIDPANLIYQVNATSATVNAAYDGGVALISDSRVTTVYAGSPPAAGHFRYDGQGLLQIGSVPVYALTADVWTPQGNQTGWVQEMALLGATRLSTVPLDMIGRTGAFNAFMGVYGADAAIKAAAMLALVGIYIASGDNPSGTDAMNQLLTPAGALLVPGRDGKLRMLVLTAIPGGSVPVLSFDDTNIVSIARTSLPATIDPPPWRMRLAYGRNWTVQEGIQLAGAAPPTQGTFAATAYRAAVGVGSNLNAVAARLNDPSVIGASGGSMELTSTRAQLIVNSMLGLWGSPRHLYEITVPRAIGLTLDWASIVNVTSDFDGLSSPGELGQIVGWRYSSADPTAMFRVLV